MEIPAISHIQGKHIFLASLDWGMGHATRSVAIVRALRSNNRILIGASPQQSAFFKTVFPDLEQIPLPSCRIHYAERAPAWLSVLFQLPKFLRAIYQEKKTLSRIVREQHIDVVISDNRYGLYHSETFNVFVSHQLNLKLPYFSGILNRLQRNRMEKFSEIWVPDVEEPAEKLAGELSRSEKIRIPVNYIGPLSALSPFRNSGKSLPCDLLLLLSGPEPQRSIFENILLKKFSDTKKKTVLVRGSETDLLNVPESFRVINLAQAEELAQLIAGAECIVCRSGYSTLMDLHLFGKKNILLVPTPGQPEQEYLATYWSGKFSAKICSQDKLRELLI